VDDRCKSCGCTDNENFFRRVTPVKRGAIARVDAFSYVPSLDRVLAEHRIVGLPKFPMLHRFEESIGGRAYTIEVKPVARDRWRAYIVRIPGVPTALMPFYGATPAAAARELSNWLTKAHERVSKPGGSV
jgi:hypothetical protein